MEFFELQSVKNLFSSNNVTLSLREITLYTNAFSIISQYVHGKLSLIEIFQVTDALSDLLTGQLPQFSLIIEKKDRLRCQYRLMEELPQTSGKLDHEEKEGLAFCIYWINCMSLFNEDTQTVESGLVDFTDFSHINQLLLQQKIINPELFKYMPKPSELDSRTYGYSKENPILVPSIHSAKLYLTKLRYQNRPVSFARIASISGNSGHILDHYIVEVKKAGLLGFRKVKIDLYIDPYSEWSVFYPPQDFSLEK